MPDLMVLGIEKKMSWFLGNKEVHFIEYINEIQNLNPEFLYQSSQLTCIH